VVSRASSDQNASVQHGITSRRGIPPKGRWDQWVDGGGSMEEPCEGAKAMGLIRPPEGGG
jgi:hypothetical protein